MVPFKKMKTLKSQKHGLLDNIGSSLAKKGNFNEKKKEDYIVVDGNKSIKTEIFNDKVLTKDFNIEKRFIYGLEAATKGQKKGKK